MSIISGNVTFTETSSNCSSNPSQILGNSTFLDSTSNCGSISSGSFYGNTSNAGSICSSAIFGDASVNSGSVQKATFSGTSSNLGSVSGSAVFAETSSNLGVVLQTAVFNGSAVNVGSISGAVVFAGSATNSGTVTEASFIGTSINAGIVTQLAVFADSASNSSAGTVQGDAVFADTTSNSGLIQGDVEVAATASNSGTVQGSSSVYTQPDGYFANGYYSGGSKTAPPNYETVVHLVGSFWYKYNASGIASLATGNYNDGSYLYNFESGIKGSIVTLIEDIFTDASIDGAYNITPYSYTTHNSRFYQDGIPYTGTHSVTDYQVQSDEYGPYGYTTSTRDIVFVVGTEVNGTVAPTVTFADGVYTITGNVDVSSRSLTSLHFADCEVTGNFNCSGNSLTSLQGAPTSVTGDFNCYGNQLTSLQYAPSSVGGDFYCSNNQFSLPIISQDIDNVYWDYASNNTRKLATNHHYVHGNYYADVATLVNNITILYAASDSNVVAANIAFDTLTNTIITNQNGLVTFLSLLWYVDGSSYGGSTYAKSGAFNLANEGSGVLVADHSNSGTMTVFNDTAFDFGHDDFTVEYFTKISGFINGIDGSDMSTGSHYPSPYFRIAFGPYTTHNVAIVIWDEELVSLPYNQGSINSMDAVLFNQWYHLAFTREGNVFNVYVNGIKLGTDTWDITFDDSEVNKMIFGGNDMYNQYINGKMAAIRIVKGTALYSGSSFTVPTTVPTAVSGTSLLLTFGATAVPSVS